MASRAGQLRFRSRYRVLTDGEVAWATDGRGTLYRFDGFLFRRRRRRDGAFEPVPSWKTPSHGWLNPADCPCAVWMVASTMTPPASQEISPDVAA